MEHVQYIEDSANNVRKVHVSKHYAKHVQKEFEKFIQPFLAQHGLASVEVEENGRDSNVSVFGVNVKFQANVLDKDTGTPVDKDDMYWRAYCGNYGLQKGDWGKKYKIRDNDKNFPGEMVQLYAIKPSNRKYPIVAKRLNHPGKEMIATPASVKTDMEAYEARGKKSSKSQSKKHQQVKEAKKAQFGSSIKDNSDFNFTPSPDADPTYFQSLLVEQMKQRAIELNCNNIDEQTMTDLVIKIMPNLKQMIAQAAVPVPTTPLTPMPMATSESPIVIGDDELYENEIFDD
jgi:hypothetical protein